MNALLSPLEQPATTLPSLRFYLLGSPIVVWHDAVLAISRRAVRALLYRLACEASSVSREHLHLLFWPDSPELAARRNLSHNLTHLRRALPVPDVLRADHDRVWLAADRVWCDALELKQARIDSSLDHSTSRDLVSYYRGAFLDNFDLPGCPEFEHWCIVERVALERKYLVIPSVTIIVRQLLPKNRGGRKEHRMSHNGKYENEPPDPEVEPGAIHQRSY
jgi:DNA-binding SARP family transcriptional activator